MPHLALVSSPLPRPFPIRTFLFFFFNAPATTEIYTLSLHDALPISVLVEDGNSFFVADARERRLDAFELLRIAFRSEEHTSELQSPMYLVCRLLLEKKKKN